MLESAFWRGFVDKKTLAGIFFGRVGGRDEHSLLAGNNGLWVWLDGDGTMGARGKLCKNGG
jgi:hypothetical protein